MRNSNGNTEEFTANYCKMDFLMYVTIADALEV